MSGYLTRLERQEKHESSIIIKQRKIPHTHQKYSATNRAPDNRTKKDYACFPNIVFRHTPVKFFWKNS